MSLPAPSQSLKPKIPSLTSSFLKLSTFSLLEFHWQKEDITLKPPLTLGPVSMRRTTPSSCSFTLRGKLLHRDTRGSYLISKVIWMLTLHTRRWQSTHFLMVQKDPKPSIVHHFSGGPWWGCDKRGQGLRPRSGADGGSWCLLCLVLWETASP